MKIRRRMTEIRNSPGPLRVLFRLNRPVDHMDSAYTNWWHTLLISFSLASWGIAQPLFDYVIGNNVFERAGAKDILVLMTVYQVLPVALLFVLDRGFGRIRFRTGLVLRSWRVSLYILASMAFLRTLQLGGHIDLLDAADSVAGMSIVLVVALIVALLVFWHYRQSTLMILYLSAASFFITILFISDVGLAGRGWDSDSAPPLSDGVTIDDTLAPVILIVFDALGGDILFEDGRIDPDRFPNLAELGRTSAVFTNATSNQTDSKFSMDGMLSGTIVSSFSTRREPENDPMAKTPLRTLADEGYSIEFHSTILGCPSEPVICRGHALYSTNSPHVAANDFAAWFLPTEAVGPIRRLVFKTLPTRVSDELLTLSPIHRGDLPLWNSFLRRLTPSEANGRFFVVHSFVSHSPYEWDRDGNQIRTVPIRDDQRSRNFETLRLAYEEQVMFLDSLVGDFISKLKQEDLFDDSSIIITGDHGPRRLGLRHTNIAWNHESEYPNEIDGMVPWVPLIIKSPGVSPEIASTEYQHLDLMPTVLELLGIPVPLGLDGVSVFSSRRPNREKIFHAYPILGGKVTYLFDERDDRWRRAN